MWTEKGKGRELQRPPVLHLQRKETAVFWGTSDKPSCSQARGRPELQVARPWEALHKDTCDVIPAFQKRTLPISNVHRLPVLYSLTKKSSAKNYTPPGQGRYSLKTARVKKTKGFSWL